MKLTLHPEHSTTRIYNECTTPVKLDLSYREIVSAHGFKDYNNNQVLTITVKHPIQDGTTTYFLKKKEDIEKTMQYIKDNDVKLHFS